MVRSSKLEFPNSAGDGMLAGRLDEPDGEIKAVALFAHCFTCSKDVLAAGPIATGLAAHGIAVLRFDFTGLGGSAGDFANTNFSSNIADLIAAANFLRRNHRAPDILIGHSLGGAAVLAAAGDMPEVKAVATIGAPSDPKHVQHLFKDQAAEIAEKGEARVQLAGRPFTIKKQFIDDIAQHALQDKIANLRKALLIFHAPLDQTVGIENATWIFQAAKHPKSFISLDTANHLLSEQRDAAYVADVICAWASRYLGAAREVAATAEPASPASKNRVTVQELGSGPYTQRITTAGGHVLYGDEPASHGGQDKGPSPTEFMLTSLGTCASITMRLYADRKGWALGRFSVALNISRRPAPPGSDEAKIDVIEKILSVEGEVSEAQRAKLIEIADKCPMHRLFMSRGKLVETRFE